MVAASRRGSAMPPTYGWSARRWRQLRVGHLGDMIGGAFDHNKQEALGGLIKLAGVATSVIPGGGIASSVAGKAASIAAKGALAAAKTLVPRVVGTAAKVSSPAAKNALRQAQKIASGAYKVGKTAHKVGKTAHKINDAVNKVQTRLANKSREANQRLR
jgi:hypothetical protein